MYKRYNAVHFVGIGGVGMSGIAEVLHALGYKVSGSDLKASESTRRLSGLGIDIKIGHGAGNIPGGAQVVVISSAVGPGNPEVAEAARRRIPVIPRAEMLAELGRLKYGVLVAGSHGKTTTTSLIATTLSRAGLDPTVVIGGRLNAMGSNARHGGGDFLVAEADESDGSFLKLSPAIAVVTNIDREHMDYFKSMLVLKQAFLDFMGKVPFYGLNVACADDPNLAELLPEVDRRVLTYGLSETAQLRAVNIKKGFMSMEYDALLDKEPLFRIKLPLPGEHNVLNSLAATGAALEAGVKPELIKDALEHFQGIGRRLELKGFCSGSGVRVYDDYGHHPTEIKATIKSLKEGLSGARLLVAFQPHRYTRTRDLFEEFCKSFDSADALVLLDIYPAGEAPIEGVNSAALFARLRARLGDRALYLKDKESAADYLARTLRDGDVALTLGAGDVWKLSEDLVRRLLNNDGG